MFNCRFPIFAIVISAVIVAGCNDSSSPVVTPPPSSPAAIGVSVPGPQLNAQMTPAQQQVAMEQQARIAQFEQMEKVNQAKALPKQ